MIFLIAAIYLIIGLLWANFLASDPDPDKEYDKEVLDVLDGVEINGINAGDPDVLDAGRKSIHTNLGFGKVCFLWPYYVGLTIILLYKVFKKAKEENKDGKSDLGDRQ